MSLVPIPAQSGPLQRLIIIQRGQHPKDNGHTGIQLHTHQPMGNGVADVFKVHRGALDEASDGDGSGEGAGGCDGTAGFGRGLGGRVASEEVDEVGGGCSQEGRSVD